MDSAQSQPSAGRSQRTFVLTKAQAQGSRAWWVVDAQGKPKLSLLF
jgi:hypothetical protein